MKRILRLAVSVMMLSATLMAAQNSQTFYLATVPGKHLDRIRLRRDIEDGRNFAADAVLSEVDLLDSSPFDTQSHDSWLKRKCTQ